MNRPLRHNESCVDYRLTLHGLADEQLSEGDKVAIESHLGECENCREELETIRQLGAELRARLPVHKAPEFLRQGIQGRNKLSNEPVRKRRFRALTGFALAGWVVAAVAVTFIFWQHRTGEQFPAAEFVKDHTNYLRNRELAQVSLSDPVALEKWFGERVDFHPVVPVINNASLLGGRVCKVADERVVLAFWAHKNETITIFTRQDSEQVNLKSMPTVEAGGRTMHHTTAEGYNLLLWRENGLLYVLVTDHPESQVAEYALSLFS